MDRGLGTVLRLVILARLHLDPHLVRYLLSIPFTSYPQDRDLVRLIEQDPHLVNPLAPLS
uniref:Uncharacterized protein n=1 Tax=uncultured Acetothermia bacterium TaxID=236499 RepID=H5S924_9BACT|nr:hypothetical protein HGMM_F02E06C24 [uncultured Acetothermia bacterium]